MINLIYKHKALLIFLATLFFLSTTNLSAYEYVIFTDYFVNCEGSGEEGQSYGDFNFFYWEEDAHIDVFDYNEYTDGFEFDSNSIAVTDAWIYARLPYEGEFTTQACSELYFGYVAEWNGPPATSPGVNVEFVNGIDAHQYSWIGACGEDVADVYAGSDTRCSVILGNGYGCHEYYNGTSSFIFGDSGENGENVELTVGIADFDDSPLDPEYLDIECQGPGVYSKQKRYDITWSYEKTTMYEIPPTSIFFSTFVYSNNFCYSTASLGYGGEDLETYAPETWARNVSKIAMHAECKFE